jgi:hypothetical protein
MDGLFLLLDTLNNSKLFAGLIMVLLNLGGKYIIGEVSEIVDDIFTNVFIKRFIIFCIFWMATRDIITSLILTALFILVMFYLINHKSKFNILTTHIKNKKNMKLQRTIPPEEVERAKKILELAHKQSQQVVTEEKKNTSTSTEEVLVDKKYKFYNFRNNIHKLKNIH